MSDETGCAVAMMCESDALGGAEMVILRLAKELHGRGYQLVGVGPDEKSQPYRETNGWLSDKFKQAGFDWRTYSGGRGLDFSCVRQLAGIFTETGIDLVHSHEFAMAVYGTAAAKLRGLPHVISMHGNQRLAEKWKARLALRWAIAESRATVAVSEMTRVDMERRLKIAPNRLHVVRNGVPERPGNRQRGREIVGVVDDCLLVVAVGSLQPRKNHELLIRALATLSQSPLPRSWRLAIAGSGAERTRLGEVAKELHVDDQVVLLGPRDDIPDLLAGADIFAMPSDWEGLPLALLEAMFAGLPIIATDVAGIPEAIENGSEGLLVPPKDQEKLGQALRTLFMNAEMREELGRAARRKARRKFSISSMTDQYEDLYWGSNSVR